MKRCILTFLWMMTCVSGLIFSMSTHEESSCYFKDKMGGSLPQDSCDIRDRLEEVKAAIA